MFSTKVLVKRKVDLPKRKVKQKILGRSYNLSLVLAGPALMRKLNRQYRAQDHVANVLAFPLSTTTGEIFINAADREFGIKRLFIHACLHLKGVRHGSIMERREAHLMQEFS